MIAHGAPLAGRRVSGEGGRDSLPTAAYSMIQGSPKIKDFWGDNMLPGIFLPIIYIPIVNWLSALVG